MNKYHTSVLLHEAIDQLMIEKGKRYIDATLGGGGHTKEILDRGAEVLGIDVDDDALSHVNEILKPEIENGKLKLARGNFKNIDKLAEEHGFSDVAGILFDLGVSSHHFDEAGRGFSVRYSGPLDMRMDQELGVKAADLVNALNRGELSQLFFTLGEERFAHRIADAIVRARQAGPIQTTAELVSIVNSVVPKKREGINPATKVFQALRIAVNDELNSLKDALPKALNLLSAGGRLAVISFHSLEDRIVKEIFKEFAEKGLGVIVTKKPIIPSIKEIEENNRSRSSKLRVFKKV